MTGAKKLNDAILIETGRINTHRNWPFEDTLPVFWGEFRQPLAALDRCTLNKGAFAFKIVRGALKWPLKGGSRLIEVAATAGLTVLLVSDFHAFPKFLYRKKILKDFFAYLLTLMILRCTGIDEIVKKNLKHNF